MILVLLAIIVGLSLLWKGADMVVRGSGAIAKNLDISPIVIGITVVAFGTSLPEMVVAIISALQGNSGITIGNIVGSNIANIGLVLGVCALFIDLKIQKHMMSKEFPFIIAAPIVLFALGLDGVLDRADGVILVLIAVLFHLILIKRVREGKFRRVVEDIAEAAVLKDKVFLPYFVFLILGFFGVILGAKLTVDASVILGLKIGISEVVIGLTIVAVGTSLPEFVTSLVAAIKKDDEISLGNIVGSNILNIFAVLGITLIIAPISISRSILIFDIPVMLVLTLLLYISLLEYGALKRREAFLLLFFYYIYIGYSFLK